VDIELAASRNIAFTIAAAQCTSVPLDIAANVQNHLRFVEAAVKLGVKWLVFPELSLTGYELAAMPALVLDPEHPMLSPIRDAAQSTGMSITVGAPVASGGRLPHIAAVTLRPDGHHAVYAKHHLHGSETRFAAAGSCPVHLQEYAGQQIASAICADTNHPRHAAQAAAAGARIFAAGILTSDNGYATEAPLWAGYAREHAMTVVIANHGGPSGGYQAAGKSVIVGCHGIALCSAQGPGDVLVIAKPD
jgi:predicted amidohydrolase